MFFEPNAPDFISVSIRALLFGGDFNWWSVFNFSHMSLCKETLWGGMCYYRKLLTDFWWLERSYRYHAKGNYFPKQHVWSVFLRKNKKSVKCVFMLRVRHMHTLHPEAGGWSDCPDVVDGGASVGPAVLYGNRWNAQGNLTGLAEKRQK